MKRLVPLLIAAVGGIALIVAYFLPATESWGVELAVWFDILAAIAFILGGGNLLKVHLQKVSEGKAGWGYSGLIIASFLVTLICGLWKVGSKPADNTEHYGETFATLPVETLPVFTVPRPPSATSIPKPPLSLRRQFSVTADELRFQGWPTPIQANDLTGLRPELEWQCAVETLLGKAVPPPELAGKIAYYADDRALSVRGNISPTQESALRTLLGDSGPAKQAVDELAAAARKATSVPVPQISVPSGWAIPDAQREAVTLADGQLRVLGPVSTGLRNAMADEWSNWPRLRPKSKDQRTAYLAELAGAAPWSPPQITAFERQLEAVWTPVQLQTAIDIAGVPAPSEKTACECLAEKQAGATDIQRTVPPTGSPQTLNAAQVAVLDRLAYAPASTPDQFVSEVTAAGPLSPPQAAAIRRFLAAAPTVAQFERDLYFAVRKLGPVTAEQAERLLAGFRRQFEWRQTIGRLFVLAHQPKSPWSGDYTEQGTPFWWIYLYVLQPLMTTTFALLAFYVASAAFRAFRAKNLEASVLLITAFIVLLRSTPIGASLSGLLPEELSFLKLDSLTAFIMKVPNTAGNRAIMIGIALGIAATSLKILLGLDRSYLGSDD